MGLNSTEGFVRHFNDLELDLGHSRVQVYHFSLFEPPLPYSDERAFVKGRRNSIELFGDGPGAAARAYSDAALDRWLPGRELVVVARYGHIDGGKNFGDDSRETIELVRDDREMAACGSCGKFSGETFRGRCT
ncbi:MAG: hypothetical protein WKH64_17655 [Chloroflexia bacterium]